LQKIVLVARAHMPADRLRNDFPLQAKLGPVETMKQLIDLQLPGARLSSMALPPRHVPYYADGVYFEVESHGAAWNELMSSSAMALSVVGEFPGLHVEAWGLREVATS
jgi:type VI secretion system protein ImpJ